jgi:hypothetical protein
MELLGRSATGAHAEDLFARIDVALQAYLDAAALLSAEASGWELALEHAASRWADVQEIVLVGARANGWLGPDPV